MSILEQFPENKVLLQSLSSTEAYLSAIVQMKCDLPFDVAGKFVRKALRRGDLSADDQERIYTSIMKGHIGEAAEFLQSKDQAKTQDIASLIQSLKNSDLYQQKFEMNIDDRCIICGKSLEIEEKYAIVECKHMFHRSCLIKEMEYLLKNNVSILRCPTCAHCLGLLELMKFLPPLLLETYDRQKSLSLSGHTSKIQCTNIKCKEIIDLNPSLEFCKYCQSRIVLDIN